MDIIAAAAVIIIIIILCWNKMDIYQIKVI